MSVLAFPATAGLDDLGLPSVKNVRPRARHLTLVPPIASGAVKSGAVDSGTVKQGRTQADSTPLRLTARGRVVVAVLVLLASAVLGPVLGTVASSLVAAESPVPAAVELVTVGQGESLWSVASAATNPGADVRETMAQIVDLNDLVSSSLIAGQVLTVPSR